MLEERRLQPKNMGLALSPSVSAKMVLVRTPLWQLFGLAPLLCEINGDQEAPATKTLFHFELLLQGESSAIFLKAKKKPLELQRTSKGFFHGKNMAFFLVEVTGFEPAASWSQTTRATNCATPRYGFFCL